MSSSALPPLYHSIDEIKALLEDPQLVQVIGVEKFITGLSKSAGVYRISAGDCSTTARVHYDAVTNRFRFEFAPLQCPGSER